MQLLIKKGLQILKIFDYNKLKDLKIPHDIANILNNISQYQGRLGLFIQQNKLKSLDNLMMQSKIFSIESSNKIENVFTTNKRLKELSINKIKPINRNEEEIVGYKNVLDIINENFDSIEIKPNYILQMHRILYDYTNIDGGTYKKTQNYITQTLANNETKIRFTPIEPYLISIKMEELCNTFQENFNKPQTNNLILIFNFIFDFVSIHPFTDGNGRIQRLLMTLLLYKTNHVIGKYISLDKIIESSKETHYETLLSSSYNWHENTNDTTPFIRYMLGILLNAYKTFERAVIFPHLQKLTAKQQIELVFKNTLLKMTKAKIIELLPHISQTTIELYLNQLLKEKYITKINNNKFSYYIKNK